MRLYSILSALLLWATSTPLPAAEEAPFRAPAVPLVTIDPYTSCWSFNDRLTDDYPRHWTGRIHAMCGIVRVDGKPMRFMGGWNDLKEVATQRSVEVRPTMTVYTFDAGPVELQVNFASPLLMDDLEALSRPISYVAFAAKSKDKTPHEVQIYFDLSGEWAVNEVTQKVKWGRLKGDRFTAMWLGTDEQKVLGRKGDDVRIDWGRVLLAAPSEKETGAQTVMAEDKLSRGTFAQKGNFDGIEDDQKMPRPANNHWPVLAASFSLGKVQEKTVNRTLLVGYDDVRSVEYFGKKLKALWRRDAGEDNDAVVIEMLKRAGSEGPKLFDRCNRFDQAMTADATAVGGEEYARLCALAYRQAIAAHKLVAGPDGKPVFLSKENFSNGSINTVDVTYPSAPLFLIYNPTLLKGMLDGIFLYSESGKWTKPFAAHDLGTYPIANGQTYGEDMPVEESGNMIILAAAIAKREHSAEYPKLHWKTLTTWANYLKENGFDPENQLCTDDFAGHLAHNTNLSIKAIVALGAYAQMADMVGDADAHESSMKLAGELAGRWEKAAADGDHDSLTFDKKGTWSQKYNLVWDSVLGLDLFPKEIAQKEIAYYLTKQNKFGLPLDSRKAYTKSDWILWTATMTQSSKDFEALVHPIYDYVNKTPSRVPVSDWHETTDGKQVGFQARSVVGGYWMPMLAARMKGGGEKAELRPPSPLYAGERAGVRGLSRGQLASEKAPTHPDVIADPVAAGKSKPLTPALSPAYRGEGVAPWKPAAGRLMTRFAKDISPDKVHPEYPRPQMVRKDWMNLNGLWQYAIRPKDGPKPEKWDGQILVPFPVESALSGVMKMVGPENRLWYSRTFDVPKKWGDKRVLLHFGAVDWDATVWVDGKQVATHRGGYDPFSADITDALKAKGIGAHEIVVSVWDPTDGGYQPRGKQVRKPEGIWYTPTTGIWQTVWLEPVNTTYIRGLRIVPNVDQREVRITVDVVGAQPDDEVIALSSFFGSGCPNPDQKAPPAAEDEKNEVRGQPDKQLVLKIKGAVPLWEPGHPELYTLLVGILKKGQQPARDADLLDNVESYFAMRKISLGKDEKGITRLMLNNKFLFQYGTLDQGFWPDGLYTAPTDEALKSDIEITKKLGFNMIRKHVKVEPDRWYYWCDKLGMLVWQDMPSGDQYIGGNDPDIKRTQESAENYEREWKAIIDANFNHPCIVMWVPFNEGWGQFDTKRIVDLTKKWDPTRLVNNASGWSDRGVGDVIDMHNYPGPGSPKPEANRAAVLGEFGGLGLPVENHTWLAKGNWGYRSFDDPKALTDAYVGLLRRMRRLIDDPGLSAAVYTQTTDVEVEVNGLLTYDRQITKMDADRAAAAAKKLYEPAAPLVTLLADARKEPSEWRYTTTKPADDWFKRDTDVTSWKSAPGGFGTEGTPGAVVRTRWDTSDIWIRRSFNLPADVKLKETALMIHHDEDAEVFINGVLAAKPTGYVGDYEEIPLADAARAAIKPGDNVIAIHCRQTTGGQYIDAGIVDTK